MKVADDRRKSRRDDRLVQCGEEHPEKEGAHHEQHLASRQARSRHGSSLLGQ